MSVNKRCPSCGYTVEDGMISCPMCGELLDIKIVKKGHPILSIVLLLVLWPIGIA
ncbi:MAG: zinc ribbon domain-containing protein, partial [Muribaculaceae bacterium]